MSPRSSFPCGRPKPALVRSKDEQTHAPSLRATWRTQLETHLKSAGLKHSDQRYQIAEAILDTAEKLGGRHFGIQDAVKQVQARHKGIGTATVYRNIKTLCDARILTETLMDAENRVVYEVYDGDHHDHIVCLDCGEIFEFESKPIETIQDKITREMGFSEESHRHVIYARCDYKARARR